MFRVQVPDQDAPDMERAHDFNFDLAVLGGGSGGLACAKEAAKHGAKVVVFDFVQPTPLKTTWGLGGTCLNVGCIPKKLMHTASIYGELAEDAQLYGWNLTKNSHDWDRMVGNIQNHIKAQNWKIRVDLRDKNVTYYNEYATFVDKHTVKSVNKRGAERTVTADKFVLAMGGRPNYPDVPGAQDYAITSDDIFSLKYHPGKTLCVGASYISLECAGFLNGLGIDTTVMVRSILLRGFDKDCSEKIGGYMEQCGVKFLRPCVPNKIECVKEATDSSAPELRVSFTQNGEEKSDIFNTVLFAIGRKPLTDKINPGAIGLKYDPNGKIPVTEEELTNVDNVYAIGDLLNAPELTPLAIQSGRLLAKRLYAGSKILTDYVNVPTTVFTPLEYGSVGLSEDAAIAKYGEENVEVYHTKHTPTEQVVREASALEGYNYAKLICNRADNERVVGLHYLGPNAGEITGGFGLGLIMGATKSDFDRLVGIHPTSSEVFTTMNITRRSGQSIDVEDC
ncbi:hypothetical protein ACHWQZ_G003913 [Mnemiopsis leidyi]